MTVMFNDRRLAYRLRSLGIRRQGLMVFCVLAMALGAGGPVGAQSLSVQERDFIASRPEMAAMQRKMFEGMAMRMVRIERLVAIGSLCQVLAEDDSDLILAAARAEIDHEQALMVDADQPWGAAYREGLRRGAFQSADLLDATDSAGCETFSQLGGTLTKILTWTGRPQESSPGVRASPRTLP